MAPCTIPTPLEVRYRGTVNGVISAWFDWVHEAADRWLFL